MNTTDETRRVESKRLHRLIKEALASPDGWEWEGCVGVEVQSGRASVVLYGLNLHIDGTFSCMDEVDKERVGLKYQLYGVWQREGHASVWLLYRDAAPGLRCFIQFEGAEPLELTGCGYMSPVSSSVARPFAARPF
jgi:hypothetical protein